MLFVVLGVFILSLFLPSLPFGAVGGGHGGGLGGIFGGGAPDGPGEQIAELSRNHVNPGQEHEAYNTVPATSGPHFGQPLAPARWGVHDEVLADEVLLHNLEHGGISVTYNCPDGCPGLLADLTEIVNEAVNNNSKVILSPYPGMETRVALTAWTFVDRLDGFDNGRIRDFVNSHESSPNAPEPNAR